MISHEHLAVKIALLSLVSDLPGQEHIAKLSQNHGLDVSGARGLENDNTLEHSGTCQGSERMPFKHELLAAQHLAFISAYSNNPKHVMAVSCHEIQDHATQPGSSKGVNGDTAGQSKIMIRIAANSGLHNEMLQKMREVGGILQNEANGVDRDTNGRTLLREVVKLNHGRILSRLRSRHARYFKARNKMPLYRRLETANVLMRKSKDTPDASLKKMLLEIDSLRLQMLHVENMDPNMARSPTSDGHLLTLITDMHSFFRRHRRQISRIPLIPGNWNIEATESLLDRFEKLVQYVEASNELLRTARRHKAFSRIDVDFINLQESGLPISTSSRPEYINTLITESCNRKALHRVSAYLQTSIENVKHRLRTRLQNSCRIHAEMQLVKFYENMPTSLRPRVIWSSKSACYLCHTFFKVYKKYYLPNTHGKLYHEWRYPLQPTISRTRKAEFLAFCAAIDKQLDDCLRRKATLRRVGGVESRVDLLAEMTPSVLSVQSQRPSGVLNGALALSRQEVSEVVMPGSSNDVNCQINNATLAPNSDPKEEIVIHEERVDGPTPAPETTTHNEEAADTNLHGARLSQCHSHDNLHIHDANMPVMDSQRSISGTETCTSDASTTSDLSLGTPSRLQFGDTAKFRFPVTNNGEKSKAIRVHAPRLHITLQHLPEAHRRSSRRDSCLDTIDQDVPVHSKQQQQQELLIDVTCLRRSSRRPNGVSSAIDGSNDTNTMFDLDDADADFDETCLPAGVLFSATGLLLRRGMTILRFRARVVDELGKLEVC